MLNKNNKKGEGKLEVICGPMFSGKSEELIRRLRRAKIAKQNIVAFKNKLDDRYELSNVVSHDGNQIEAHALADVNTLLDLGLEKDIDVIGIDEVSFFTQEIVPIICKLVDAGKRVIVAGFELDFRGVPMTCMPLLLAIADSVLKLKAICTLCGTDAHFTQRLVNGEPAKYDDPLIIVGGQDSYQARCRKCHKIDKAPTFNEQKQINV